MPWHQKLMKDVVNNDMLRGVVNNFDPEISEWGNLIQAILYRLLMNTQLKDQQPGELKHLSSRWKRKKTRFSQQWRAKREQPKPDLSGVVGSLYESYKIELQLNCVGKQTLEGDSPVNEMVQSLEDILSRAGHEKPCLNLRGPSRKAKYSLVTDSEQVP